MDALVTPMPAGIGLKTDSAQSVEDIQQVLANNCTNLHH